MKDKTKNRFLPFLAFPLLALAACGEVGQIEEATNRLLEANSQTLALNHQSFKVLECKQTGAETGVCNVEMTPKQGNPYNIEIAVTKTAFNGWQAK